MEENHTDMSPLGAYPNENSLHIVSQNPWYRSKYLLIGVVTCSIVGIGILGGYMVLGNKNAKTVQAPKMITSPTPISTSQEMTKVTPAEITANWKTYTNDTYAYSIKYEPTTAPIPVNSSPYGYTDFSNGCARVYAVPQAVVKTLTEEKNGIPWKQLSDLKTMTIGERRNCSVLTFTFGEDGAAVVDRNEYVRNPSQNIANTDWYTYTIKNGESSAVDIHTVSFTEKNDMTYLVETKTGGQCPVTQATDILSTFSFTK